MKPRRHTPEQLADAQARAAAVRDRHPPPADAHAEPRAGVRGRLPQPADEREAAGSRAHDHGQQG